MQCAYIARGITLNTIIFTYISKKCGDSVHLSLKFLPPGHVMYYSYKRNTNLNSPLTHTHTREKMKDRKIASESEWELEWNTYGTTKETIHIYSYTYNYGGKYAHIHIAKQRAMVAIVKLPNSPTTTTKFPTPLKPCIKANIWWMSNNNTNLCVAL